MWAQYCMAGSIPRTSSVPRVFPYVSVSNRETLNGCQIKVFSKVYDAFTIATCTHRLAHSSGIGRVVSDKLKWDKNTPLSYIVKLLLFKDESDVIIALRHIILLSASNFYSSVLRIMCYLFLLYPFVFRHFDRCVEITHLSTTVNRNSVSVLYIISLFSYWSFLWLVLISIYISFRIIHILWSDRFTNYLRIHLD